MKLPWRGTLALALAVALLWLVFRRVAWAEVRHALVTANLLLATLSVAVVTLVFPMRALRWRPILDPVAPNLPFGPLWRATAMGFMMNNAGGRLGEFVRAIALSRETQVPVSTAFASLIVDRTFDLLVVLLLMVVAMLDPAFPADALIGGQSSNAIVSFGLLLLAAVAGGLYVVVFFPDRFIRLFDVVAGRVTPRFVERGRALLRTFADGLSSLRDPRRFVVIFLWAAALWLTQCLSFWIMFRAFGLDVPFTATMLMQALIVFAVAVPTPGFIGVFEAAAVAGLMLYGVDNSTAAAWAILYHVLSLVPITLIGLYYLFRSGIRLSELKQLKL